MKKKTTSEIRSNFKSDNKFGFFDFITYHNHISTSIEQLISKAQNEYRAVDIK
jgi:hypothetical protein